MTQLLLHLWGDYILQSDWMAKGKTIWWLPCLLHVTLYSLPFLLVGATWRAFVVIFATHYLIDRYRLARFLTFAKNWEPKKPQFWKTGPIQWYPLVTSTGYPTENPAWLAVWLLIIADNILHLTINFLALKYL